MRIAVWLSIFTGCFLLTSCGPPKSIPVDDVLQNLDAHLGKVITIKARFKSGARCKQSDGEWKTYCKGDCQYCRGPLVVATDLDLKANALNDWPIVLGGTYKSKDIRCKGPMNQLECYPLELGKLYVVRGLLERYNPPRLMVDEFWAVPN